MLTTTTPTAARLPPAPPEIAPPDAKPATPKPAAAAPAPKDTVDRVLSLLADPKLVSGVVRALRGGTTTRAASTGYASSAALTRSDVSFLRDPNLSIEEKLMKLLGVMNKKWEKEMQQKLDQIAAGEGAPAPATSASKAKSKGGFLGSIKDALGGITKALGPAGKLLEGVDLGGLLKKVSGPVLAAAASALGVPAAAPLLLRYGPAALEAASSVASAVGSGAPAAAGGSAAQSAQKMSDAERQALLMEIQRIQSKQQEMLQLVSNVLKSNHDARSSVINNIR
jgi:hypothetical protein